MNYASSSAVPPSPARHLCQPQVNQGAFDGRGLKTTLVKTDITPFINRLWGKAYRRGEVFRQLHSFWASGTRSQLIAEIAAGDSALLEADTWLADAIGSCLDRSAAAVELFFRRPESNDLYAEAQGVITLLRIAALARHEPGAAMTQAEQAFDDSKPLFMGMGNDEALLAVTQIASEFGMLSDRCRTVYRAVVAAPRRRLPRRRRQAPRRAERQAGGYRGQDQRVAVHELVPVALL